MSREELEGKTRNLKMKNKYLYAQNTKCKCLRQKIAKLIKRSHQLNEEGNEEDSQEV